MQEFVQFRGFSPEYREILHRTAREVGMEPVETGDASFSVVALGADFDADDLEREIYLVRDSICAFLVDPSRPELLARLSVRGVDLIALLPPTAGVLKSLLAAMGRRKRERELEERLCRGLKSLEHRYEWRADELRVTKVACHLADQYRMKGFCSSSVEAEQLQLALEEALTNSLEHGCLALDSAVKTSGPDGILRYESLKEERLGQEPYCSRGIELELTIEGGTARLAIHDEGDGFDSATVEAQGLAPEAEAGKGIRLIKSVFDRVDYSDGGKMVTLLLTKRRGDDDDNRDN